MSFFTISYRIISEIGILALFLHNASRNPTVQSNIVSVPTNFNLIPLKSKKSEQFSS